MRIKCDSRDFLCFFLLSCAVVFFCYMVKSAFPYKGIFDFPTFVNAALNFEKSGTLYRDENGYATNLSVYKFPPLLASILVHGARWGLVYEDFFIAAFWLHIFSYLGAIFLVIAAGFSLFSISRRMVVVLFSIGLLFCPLLDTNFIRLQLDAYVLLLLSASLYSLLKKRTFLCGFLIGLAAALKIYPAMLLACLLVLGLWEAVAGVAVGFLLATLYCAAILGVTETLHFFTTVLPVLMQELPAGGGDGNISFPTLFHNVMMSVYIAYDMNVFSENEFNLLAESRNLDMDTILVRNYEIAHVAKATTSVLLLGLMYASFRIRMKFSQACYAAVFSAFVIFNITFMPNSWLNYQVVLVAPILIISLYLIAEYKKSDKLFWLAILGIFSLWAAATLDAFQERANHYHVDDVQLMISSGLTVAGRWVRCIAALLLLFVCLSLAARRLDSK